MCLRTHRYYVFILLISNKQEFLLTALQCKMSKDLNSTEIEKLKQEISTILKQEIPETKELKQEIYTDFKEWNDVSVSFERWREHSCELQAQLRELKQETTENSEGVSKEISTSCDASSEDKLLVDNCEKKKKEKV